MDFQDCYNKELRPGFILGGKAHNVLANEEGAIFEYIGGKMINVSPTNLFYPKPRSYTLLKDIEIINVHLSDSLFSCKTTGGSCNFTFQNVYIRYVYLIITILNSIEKEIF